MTKVLITRELHSQSPFWSRLSEKGYQVEARSFIKTQPIPFGQIPEVDWYFFTSPKAVQHFYHSAGQLHHRPKIAAMGSGTAKALQHHAIVADFTGTGDPEEVATNFANLLGKESVLFPRAKESLRSIQLALPHQEQIREVIVYETIEIPASEDSQAAILVFTSPSNVRAYFQACNINSHQHVVAIGPSTKKELLKNGVNKVSQSWEPSEEALVDTILGL